MAVLGPGGDEGVELEADGCCWCWSEGGRDVAADPGGNADVGVESCCFLMASNL